MEQPPGFEKTGNETKVLKLHKSIYGLKQSAKTWNKKANKVLTSLEFKRGEADKCLYSRKENNGVFTYILLYVDDMLIAGASKETTGAVSKRIGGSFDVKDLGDVNYYIDTQVERKKDGSFLISQRTKIIKLLEDCNMLEAKPADTPMEPGFLSGGNEESPKLPNNKRYRQVAGSLFYIATISRPDITAAVGILCRRIESPTEEDWKAMKCVLRYLISTVNRKLILPSKGNLELTCYSDADWAGDQRDRKSTSGVFLLGNGVVAWSSRKQTSVDMSSTEAKNFAASHAGKELLWLRYLLRDLGVQEVRPITFFEDNQGCIRMIEMDRCGAYTKHIDVSHHFIRDLKEKKIIEMDYCQSSEMLADILTKPMVKERLSELTKRLGVI